MRNFGKRKPYNIFRQWCGVGVAGRSAESGEQGTSVGEGEGDGGWLDGNVGVHYNGMEVNVYIVCNMYVCVYIYCYMRIILNITTLRA